MAPIIKRGVETMKKACWMPTQGTLRGAEGADSPWKEWGQGRGLHRKGEMDQKFQVRDTAEKADQGPLRISHTTHLPIPAGTCLPTDCSLSVSLPLFVLKSEFKYQGAKEFCFQNEISVAVGVASSWPLITRHLGDAPRFSGSALHR